MLTSIWWIVISFFKSAILVCCYVWKIYRLLSYFVLHANDET